MATRLLTWILAAALVSGQPAPPPYRLKVGDTIKILLKGDDHAVPSRVDADGFVTVALVGRLRVAGFTLKEVAQEVACELEDFVLRPIVWVELVRPGGGGQ